VPRRKKQTVKIIRPHEPAARDEGPRLIPFDDEDHNEQHTAKLQHYVNLADIALKNSRRTEEAR